jgi:hypothetical protein
MRARRLGRSPALLGSLAGYLALLFLSFLPQSLRPADTIAYVGDSLESVYIVAWNVHQFFTQPLRLFEANVLHPLPHALAFTDHRLLPSLLVAPVVWTTGNAVLATNAAAGLACVFAAMAARHLARRLGADAVAAWAAGALYGFHTYQVNEAPRLNIVFHGFLPLAIGELLALLRTGERRHAWAVSALLLLQGLSSNYHLLYGSALVLAIALAALALRPRLVWPRLRPLALPALAAALVFLPIAWPYLQLSRAHALGRELPEGIDLVHYVSTAPGNLLYGAIGTEVRLQQRGPHFVGFASLALALAAVAWRRRGGDSGAVSARIWVPAAAALAVALVVLSLGRDAVVFGVRLGPGPYRLLYEYVPGFQLVRIPERLSLLAMLFVALLAARALSLLRAFSPGAATLLAVWVPLEHVSILGVTERVPAADGVPAVYGWLASSDARAVAEVPIRGEGLVRAETLEMYFSSAHWRPIIHGYTAYPPLVTRLLRRLAAEFPSDASLAALRRVGVDTVVVHHGRELAFDLAHQVPGRDDASNERFRRLMQLASLDLYDRLPDAVASGKLKRLASFEGQAARLHDSTRDEVYRIAEAPALAPAPFPPGRRQLGRAWRYRTKAGDPAPAADGDLSTAWTVPRALRGDEFLEVLFDRPLAVTGVVLPLRRDSAFPTRFRIGARDLDGNWAEVARYDGPHQIQLLESTLRDPTRAAVGFVLSGREITGLNLLVEEGGTSFEGWRLPEFEVWIR